MHSDLVGLHTVGDSAHAVARARRTSRNSKPPSELAFCVLTTAPALFTSAICVDGARPVTYTWRALPTAVKFGAAAVATVVGSDAKTSDAAITIATASPPLRTLARDFDIPPPFRTLTYEWVPTRVLSCKRLRRNGVLATAVRIFPDPCMSKRCQQRSAQLPSLLFSRCAGRPFTKAKREASAGSWSRFCRALSRELGKSHRRTGHPVVAPVPCSAVDHRSPVVDRRSGTGRHLHLHAPRAAWRHTNVPTPTVARSDPVGSGGTNVSMIAPRGVTLAMRFRRSTAGAEPGCVV